MVYADNVANITIVGPNARIRFEAIKEAKQEGDETSFQTEETLTLVLPVPALGKLAGILEDLKQQIKAQQEKANAVAELVSDNNTNSEKKSNQKNNSNTP